MIRQQQASEQQFKRRFNALKKIYESRIDHLTASIQKTFNAVNNDPVIMAMSEEATTREFVPRAVGDIVTQDLRDEREHFIQVRSGEERSDELRERIWHRHFRA